MIVSSVPSSVPFQPEFRVQCLSTLALHPLFTHESIWNSNSALPVRKLLERLSVSQISSFRTVFVKIVFVGTAKIFLSTERKKSSLSVEQSEIIGAHTR